MTKIEDFVDEVVEDNAVSVEEMATPKIGPTDPKDRDWETVFLRF